MNIEFPNKRITKRMFDECCRKVGISEFKSDIKNLSMYELTDGTRTSTDLDGWEAYVDGGIFILRLFHLMSNLGVRHSYVLTTGDAHRVRDNYNDIIKALEKEVDIYSEYLKKHKIKMKFYGNFKGLGKKFKDALANIEDISSKNDGLLMYTLINYSSDKAQRDKKFKDLPNANVIIKHTKGQVNEGLWLPGKLKENSFVYVQNASVSTNWSDRDLVYLIAISLRSMILHRGRQYSKSYTKGEKEDIRKRREKDMVFIHKKLEKRPTKRIVMFSHVGPEIYEF